MLAAPAPVPPGDRRSARSDRRPIRRGRALSVIVVDDSDDLRAIFSEVLAHAGWSVRAYASAEAALAAIASRRPDVVLTDINLGSLSGRGLARALRADPRTEDLAIVAASGSVLPTAWTTRAFDAFVTKPVDVGSLSDTLLDAIERAKR